MIVAGSFAVRQSKNDSRGIPGAGIRGFGSNWIQKKGVRKRGGICDKAAMSKSKSAGALRAVLRELASAEKKIKAARQRAEKMIQAPLGAKPQSARPKKQKSEVKREPEQAPPPGPKIGWMGRKEKGGKTIQRFG
jgi:hypothetical protein